MSSKWQGERRFRKSTYGRFEYEGLRPKRLTPEQETMLVASMATTRTEYRKLLLNNHRVAVDAINNLKRQFEAKKLRRIGPEGIATFNAAVDRIEGMLQVERDKFRLLETSRDDELAAAVAQLRADIVIEINTVMSDFGLSLDCAFFENERRTLEGMYQELLDGSSCKIAGILDEVCEDVQGFRRLIFGAEDKYNCYTQLRNRLVFSCYERAQRSIPKSVPGFEDIGRDLFQNCMLALIEAAERFDPVKFAGVPFAAFASYSLKLAIQSGIAANAHVAASVSRKLRSKIVKAERELRQELGREPTDEEIARRACKKLKTVLQVRAALAPPAQINPSAEYDGDEGGGYDVPVEDDPGKIIENRELQREIARALSELPEQERRFFERHTLDGRSFTQLSEGTNRSREWVRQKVKKAKNRLQDSVLKDYFDEP